METTSNPRHSDNLIVNLTFDFAISIVNYAELLGANKKFVIANQVLRSGTSIGANVREAQNAESAKDFIHKLKVAMKEAEETEYWLLICDRVETYPDAVNELTELNSVRKVLSKIIKTMVERHKDK